MPAPYAHQARLRFVDKSFSKDTGQSGLALWHPARVVLSHCLFVVSKQVSNVCDRNAFLQEDPGKGMPEPMWSRRFLELSGEFKSTANFSPPKIRHRFQPVGAAGDEWPRTTFFR